MIDTQSRNDLADRESFIGTIISDYTEPDRSDLAAYLRANPGHTVRDWKAKGPTIPQDAERGETPWPKLKPNEVREAAIAASARDLPRNVRQAAAHDPALIWNPLARKYRLRLDTDPLPGVKSSEADHLGTGAGLENESKHAFPTGSTRARPRP